MQNTILKLKLIDENYYKLDGSDNFIINFKIENYLLVLKNIYLSI